MTEDIINFYVFYIGAAFGSFLNVVIHRLPIKKDLVFERSHCPKCKRQLSWYHNIPLFSYLFLFGKCAFCKEKIKPRYFVVELLMGLGVSFLFIKYGVSLELFLFCVIWAIFICHFFIDLDHSILPDSLNFILLAVALIMVSLTGEWKLSLIGAAIGFGGTFGITLLFYYWKGKVGMGGGDIKLYGVLGLILGPLGILQNIFLSCFLGTFIMIMLIVSGKIKKDQPAPFGPSILIIGSWQIFFPDNFTQFMVWFNELVLSLSTF